MAAQRRQQLHAEADRARLAQGTSPDEVTRRRPRRAVRRVFEVIGEALEDAAWRLLAESRTRDVRDDFWWPNG